MRDILHKLFGRSSPLHIKLLRSIFLLYIFLGLYGWLLSDSAIFFPPKPTYASSDNILFIKTDQQQIAAVYLKNENSTHTILYSHGNAVDLGGLQRMIGNFYNNGFSVLAYDYSGYGLSDGSPSEQAVYNNAQAAYDFLINELGAPPQSIIAYGHSLGGAVAADLASKNSVAGLILESTFVSAFRVRTVVSLYPFDKFTTLDKLSSINAPVLIMHSRDDPVIPFWHSESLFAAANEPKTNYWTDNGGHGGVSYSGKSFWDKLAVFVESMPGQQ